MEWFGSDILRFMSRANSHLAPRDECEGNGFIAMRRQTNGSNRKNEKETISVPATERRDVVARKRKCRLPFNGFYEFDVYMEMRMSLRYGWCSGKSRAIHIKRGNNNDFHLC